MPSSPTIVVTGANSGIGRAVAERLRDESFEVVGTVRSEQAAEQVRDLSVHPVLLDVTDSQQIQAAREEIHAFLDGRGLDGLVNNAGMFLAGPLECLAVPEIRKAYDVNVFGLLELTQALLPDIRRARGRIVNVGSMSGRVSLPMAGPYASSKFALEALSDALRRELRPWGIRVSLINPANVKTPLWEKSISRARVMESELPADARSLYGEQIERSFQLVEQEIGKFMASPDDVASCVLRALRSKRPKPRYFVGSALLLDWLIWLTPDRTFDWLVARKLGISPK